MEELEMLRFVNMRGIKLRDVEEFEKKRAEKCTDGFSPDNFKLVFGEDNRVKKGTVENNVGKWLDQYTFVELLAEYLVDGQAKFIFIDEKFEEEKFVIIPGVVLYDDFEYLTNYELSSMLDDQSIPYKRQLEIFDLYIEKLLKKQREIERKIESARDTFFWIKKLSDFDPTKIDEFELVEIDIDSGKDYLICKGIFKDCVSKFESMYGTTYYEGVEFNRSKFYVRQI